MTIVRISRGKPEVGGIGPLGGKIQFTPTRGWVEGSSPEVEVLPHPFTVDVPPGTGYFEVDLKPTSPGWAWRAYAYGFGSLPSRREHVLVPLSGPVYFHRLARVDPKTLDPTVEPEAAWWAEVASAKAMASDVEAARVEAVAAKDEAVDARDIAVAAAEAVGSAGYSATISPEYDHALRIFYSAALSPRPNVVRIPIGETP